jgi:serine/threonine-protein kinase
MAVVFRAVDERLGRQVALKILAPALASDEAFRQRFIRESRSAAAVDDPHTIPVHEAGETGSGVLFIVMRYVPGRDVRSLLHREGPLPPGRVVAIISPVASALDASHAAGLVHRDVKPANMLLDVRPGRPDHVYLSDFGLSKGVLSSVGLTGFGQYLGTPNYTAPEQIEGKPVDGRTDQYALACAAFEMLAGQAPFQRDDATAVIWAHMSTPPPSLTSLRPELPTEVNDVFARALAKAPADRYARCADFAEALRKALSLPPYYSVPAATPAPDAAAADHPATEVAWPADAGAADMAIPVAVATAADSGPGTADGRAPQVTDEPVHSAMTTMTSAPSSGEQTPRSSRDGTPGQDTPAPPGRSQRARMLAQVLIGVGLLAAGIVTDRVYLGAAGGVVLLLSLMWTVVSRPPQSSARQARSAGSGPSAGAARQEGWRARLMEWMEARWRRRQEGNRRT